MAGSPESETSRPLWLLAELTYRCPLQCLYCSNPVALSQGRRDLSTDTWLRVLAEARALGAVQLGLSGGEPLLRDDLEVLVERAADLGYYSNLITSGVGLSESRLAVLKEAGLDHVQLSFQASDPALNDAIGGARTFAKKLSAARAIKALGFPMVLNVVLHRHNIDGVAAILAMADNLEADYVELANVQFGGWAALNRPRLLPTRDQLERAEAEVADFRGRQTRPMEVFFVVSDYYESRPKPCTAGWGRTFMQIAPDGTALPCHGAQSLPGMALPRVDQMSIEDIWRSPAFERFRGDAWMKAPCRTCPERERDFGGCRCQAYALTGDPRNADPVCSLSPHRHVVDEAIAGAGSGEISLEGAVFRNARNAEAHTRKVALPRA